MILVKDVNLFEDKQLAMGDESLDFASAGGLGANLFLGRYLSDNVSLTVTDVA